MPQPIDPSTETVRVSTTERVQQTLTRAAVLAQEHQRNDMVAQQVAAESQVQQVRPKETEVEPEARRRAPYVGRRRRRQITSSEDNATAAESHKAPLPEGSGGSLDLLG